MGKVLRLLTLLIVVGLLLAPPMPAHTQEALRVLDTHVTSDFPLSITFHVEAQGPADISKAEVRFRVEQQSCAQAESSGFAELDPAKNMVTQWKWDMRKGGSLPPGAVVRYHWVLQDASGDVLDTPEETYEVVDDRYTWQAIDQDPLTLYWYNGEPAFASPLMNTAQEALDRLEASAGTRPLRPVKLFIYGSAQDLQGALVHPQEWTGGVSFTGFNIVAIGITPAALAWGQRAIAHELTHVVVGQVTFNCFRDIPTWLSEGLATYNEDASREPLPAYASALKEAVAAGGLISVRGLSGGFPTSQEDALLAYGESFSLVQYLTEEYGPEKLGALLAMYRSGNTTDVALEQVYRLDQEGLEEEWRRHIGAPLVAKEPPDQTPTSLAPPVPAFELFTLSTPTPPTPKSDVGTTATEATPTPIAADQEPTHAVGPASSGGGCSGGLPPPANAGSQELGAAALPVGFLMLAGLAFGVRRRTP